MEDKSILTPVNCVCGRAPEVGVHATDDKPFSLSCTCGGQEPEKKIVAKTELELLANWRELIRGLETVDRNIDLSVEVGVGIVLS